MLLHNTVKIKAIRAHMLLFMMTAFCSLVVFSSVNCSAQDVATIAVLDIPKLLDQTTAGKQAKKNTEAEIAKRKEVVERLKKQVDSLRSEYERQQSVLSAEARVEKQQAYRAKEDELRELILKDENEMIKFQGGEVEKIMKRVDSILADLSKKLGYKFVIEREPGIVIYRDDKIDVTDRVIRELE